MKSKPNFGRDIYIVPYPITLELLGGYAGIPVKITLYEEAKSEFSRTLRSKLSARKTADAKAATVQLLLSRSAPEGISEWAVHPEGYGMLIDQNGIRIWASTGAGHLYGVITLCQLRRQYGRRIPCMMIADAPVLDRRGVQLTFPQGHTCYLRSYVKHLIPHLAKWKINELYLYLETYFDFPSLPHMAGPDAMTPADAEALQVLCHSYNIRVIPIISTLTHCGEILATQRYQYLSEYNADSEDQRLANTMDLCANSKDVNKLIDGMIHDICNCFDSDIIHVGGDEVAVIGKCRRCQKANKKQDALALYLNYFGRILDVLQGHGRKGGLWGDMLFGYGKTVSRSIFKRRLKPIADRVVIYDWHYQGGAKTSLRLFADMGLPTIACSSTQLCYSSALWPFQYKCQGELFRDAVQEGALGGMTTTWVNWAGLHEEHFNYLHAAGGALLWSGMNKDGSIGRLSLNAFEAAYNLQRYGIRSRVLTDYLHAVGDAGGPILSVLEPLHGVESRKCLYHTDNVLLFWQIYAKTLSGDGLKNYKKGVAVARRLWMQVIKQRADDSDPFLDLLAGPLLMHEHLILRYEMTELIYQKYDAAAKVQYQAPARFRQLLNQAATHLEAHLSDFAPIDNYLSLGRKKIGFDRSTSNRIRATKRKIVELAALLRHLTKSHRPLPIFRQLADTFIENSRTRWYGDREHEWASESRRFQRYTVDDKGPWRQDFATPKKWKEKVSPGKRG